MGKRETICGYDNCAVYGSPLPIAVSVSLDRPDFKHTERFCCEEHAALWLMNEHKRLTK